MSTIEMSPKERLLASIKGEETDRVPWSPFLAYFWEDQSEEIQQRGQLEFLENIGADPLLRGVYGTDVLQLFKLKRNCCHVNEIVKTNIKHIIYETPVGNLKESYKYSTDGNTWFLVEHPVKNAEDFKILTYLNEDLTIIPDNKAMKKFKEIYKKTGNRALYLPIIGTGTTVGAFKSSFQAMVEHWVGTEQLVYSLYDYPEIVKEALQEMRKNSIDTVKISVQSPAEAFIFWEDTSTTNISPQYFSDYVVPEINDWGEIIHQADKFLIHHACGHLKDLISLMAKTKIDMIESISPPPTGNIEIWDAALKLPENIGLIGGIEPTVFLFSNLNELKIYVQNLLNRMRGYKFILANSDSCPPGVSLEKFKMITELIKKEGYR